MKTLSSPYASATAFRSAQFHVSTRSATAFIDLTDRLDDFVSAEPTSRLARSCVQTLHTTTASSSTNTSRCCWPTSRRCSTGWRLAARPTGTTTCRRAPASRPTNARNGHAHCRALLLPPSAASTSHEGRSAARPLAAGVPGRAGRPARARGLGARDRRGAAMKVKMILPALTEATSPFWRPIKYSLFPPLGLATLAAYLERRRRGRDSGRARRAARLWTTSRISSSFRSTSRPRTAPTASPITTAPAARTSRSADCT